MYFFNWLTTKCFQCTQGQHDDDVNLHRLTKGVTPHGHLVECRLAGRDSAGGARVRVLELGRHFDCAVGAGEGHRGGNLDVGVNYRTIFSLFLTRHVHLNTSFLEVN